MMGLPFSHAVGVLFMTFSRLADGAVFEITNSRRWFHTLLNWLALLDLA
jgi:hypothetical protein